MMRPDLLMLGWLAEHESKLVIDVESRPVGMPQKALQGPPPSRLVWSAREHERVAEIMGWDPED